MSVAPLGKSMGKPRKKEKRFFSAFLNKIDKKLKKREAEILTWKYAIPPFDLLVDERGREYIHYYTEDTEIQYYFALHSDRTMHIQIFEGRDDFDESLYLEYDITNVLCKPRAVLDVLWLICYLAEAIRVDIRLETHRTASLKQQLEQELEDISLKVVALN